MSCSDVIENGDADDEPTKVLNAEYEDKNFSLGIILKREFDY